MLEDSVGSKAQTLLQGQPNATARRRKEADAAEKQPIQPGEKTRRAILKGIFTFRANQGGETNYQLLSPNGAPRVQKTSEVQRGQECRNRDNRYPTKNPTRPAKEEHNA